MRQALGLLILVVLAAAGIVMWLNNSATERNRRG